MYGGALGRENNFAYVSMFSLQLNVRMDHFLLGAFQHSTRRKCQETADKRDNLNLTCHVIHLSESSATNKFICLIKSVKTTAYPI